MPPFMGLTSWAAFTPGHDGKTMMMGDTVLFEDEVNPAMSATLEDGFEVAALHNHFFFDDPKVYFMHIGGKGDAGAVADGAKKIYDKSPQRSARLTRSRRKLLRVGKDWLPGARCHPIRKGAEALFLCTAQAAAPN